ncbi:DsbC family protein [Ralstonia pseudosolanacearum]|uniref:DsbC family protein n=1 Tax=Ralstonia pseudosolanacearum TaxID=1310165 RepID=UPI0008F8C235|nr:DsbC family protein [Ralstonia pseudosolanacearum]APC69637.1 DsbC family protein [Ralstonia solanacearum OE1-1]NKA07416.1 thiol:disulfide interchange protein [Ralstonia solanacearum]MBX9430526.1 DsbC family protein [Ralstonia pseudosolanacearum]OIN73272.1 thiol:disulfide interchange protein [Ralstonia solanacearum]QWF61592.1 DsbC family protein [Ralstonia solanacearum]
MSFRIRVAAIASAVLVVAMGAGYALTAGAAEPALDKVKASVQKALGSNVEIKGVAKSPLPGLYEVNLGSQVVYTDATGRYVLNGDLLDTQTATNLTQERMAEINRIKWSDLPLDRAVKWVKGNGARKVAVFSDPNCPYCHKLEQMFSQVDNITVYTFLFPILSEDSNTKAKQIWCASDRAKAWRDWMVSKSAPGGAGNCDTPLEDNLKLGRALNVNGTPAIIFMDGSRAPGLIDAATLERKFASLKKS